MTTTTEYREAVAAEVRAAMARKRVTQADLADSLGIARPTLSERISGRRAFDTDLLFRIAAALSVDVTDFLAPATRPEEATA